MADPSTGPPLTRASVLTAHAAITPFIHRTRVATNATLSALASTPQAARCPSSGANEAEEPAPHAHSAGGEDGVGERERDADGVKEDVKGGAAGYVAAPQVKLWFKCENEQRIGAFKARGAFHALGRLVEERGLEVLKRGGVCTHSSGNHAQALALAARSHGVPAHIVMPSISTPSKIAGTRAQGARVVFSGSTSEEREAVLADVVAETGAVLVPPYDHPDIVLGQGTMALELQEQVGELGGGGLDAVVAPVGGGGMLSGVCTALAGTGVRVFGAEPRFQGADDAERGLREGRRVESVKTLTIADGLRTPVGKVPWGVISDGEKLAGVYSVTEEQIKAALKLAMERAKLFVEPSAAVPLAVVLYNEEFRRRVEKEAGGKQWNIGIILSGGNTTVEAIAKLYAAPSRAEDRADGTVGMDGGQKVENVAG